MKFEVIYNHKQTFMYISEALISSARFTKGIDDLRKIKWYFQDHMVR